jgi:hypothetical protein
MDLGIDGRTVIVTGASGGLGRCIARGFAAEGADVVLTYHSSRPDAEQLAKEIGGQALVVPYELDDAETASALVESALQWTGRIDVLVNNAVHWGGDAPSPDRPFEAVPEADWLKVLRANTEGALRLSRAVAPVMRERRWGRMVHISSNIAADGMAGAEHYTPARALPAAWWIRRGRAGAASGALDRLGHQDVGGLELDHGVGWRRRASEHLGQRREVLLGVEAVGVLLGAPHADHRHPVPALAGDQREQPVRLPLGQQGGDLVERLDGAPGGLAGDGVGHVWFLLLASAGVAGSTVRIERLLAIRRVTHRDTHLLPCVLRSCRGGGGRW